MLIWHLSRTFQKSDGGFHSDGNAIGQTLTVDYGKAYEIDKIEYYPRDDAGNGTVEEMKLGDKVSMVYVVRGKNIQMGSK